MYTYIYIYISIYLCLSLPLSLSIYIYVYIYIERETARELERLNGIQWSWVQIPLRPTFYSYFKESFSDEYHIYIHTPQGNINTVPEIVNSYA